MSMSMMSMTKMTTMTTMARMEQQQPTFGLGRGSSSCFGPPPLLIQLVLASRCHERDWAGEKVLRETAPENQGGSHEGQASSREGRDVGGDGAVRTTMMAPFVMEGAENEEAAVSSKESSSTQAAAAALGHRVEQHPSTNSRPSPTKQLSASEGKTSSPPALRQQTDSTYTIRKAGPEDIPQLGDVERSAGEVFRTVGLEALADDEPMPQEVLRGYANAGHVWVAVAAASDVAGRDGVGAGVRGRQARLCGGGGDDEAGSRGDWGGEDRIDEGEAGAGQVHEKQEEVNEAVVGFLACFPIAHHHYRYHQHRHDPFRDELRAQARQQHGVFDGTDASGDDSIASAIKEVGGQEKDDTAHLHIAELSVHAAHQKRGIGRRLLAAMFDEIARCPRVPASGFFPPEEGQDENYEQDLQDGHDWRVDAAGSTSHSGRRGKSGKSRRRKVLVQGYSLTTYRHLSFNRRFYESVGFEELEADRIEQVVGRRGRELWDEEQAGILRREMRCWMIRAM